MRVIKCIFCGECSTNSKSVEHIIPESLGNKTLILRKVLYVTNAIIIFPAKLKVRCCLWIHLNG